VQDKEISGNSGKSRDEDLIEKQATVENIESGSSNDSPIDSFNFISKLQIEADNSLFNSILHELRLELQGKTNKNSLELKKLHENTHAELSRLTETLRELSSLLKTDGEIVMNDYKAELREESQKIDSLLHHHNGDLTVSISGFKKDTESVKLRSIYSFTASLLAMFVMIIFQNALKRGVKTKSKMEME
jgi:hypothetical protein